MADQQHQDRCAFFLKRKQRFCKLVPGPGKKFCGEHANFAPENETGAGRKRVSCPLDPNHTCYEDQLKKHLKKCNSKQGPPPLYLQKGVNSGVTCEQSQGGDASKISHHSLSTEQLVSFVERVNAAYKASISSIPEAVLAHQGMKDMLEDPTNGPSALKHLKQQASLIGHLDRLHLLRSNVCFVEFGAGRGRLSHYVQMCLPPQAASHFILIDRANTKHKFDKNFRRGEKGPDFERLKVDIEDLNLGLVPSMAEHKGPVVGISKHLCGAATDLTLRCLIETLHCNRGRSSFGEGSAISSTTGPASTEQPVLNRADQDSNETELQSEEYTTPPVVKDMIEHTTSPVVKDTVEHTAPPVFKECTTSAVAKETIECRSPVVKDTVEDTMSPVVKDMVEPTMSPVVKDTVEPTMSPVAKDTVECTSPVVKEAVACTALPVAKDTENHKESIEDQRESSSTGEGQSSSPPSKRLKGEATQDTSQVEAVLIALCCHHRCSWPSYVGRGFFTDMGLTEDDFYLLRSMSSWATCGFAKTQKKNEGGNDDEVKENSDSEEEDENYEQSKAAAIWSVEEREEIGRQCKRLLDQGRLWYLQQHDFHTELVHYVGTDVSLENTAIIATRGKSAYTT